MLSGNKRSLRVIMVTFRSRNYTYQRTSIKFNTIEDNAILLASSHVLRQEKSLSHCQAKGLYKLADLN